MIYLITLLCCFVVVCLNAVLLSEEYDHIIPVALGWVRIRSYSSQPIRELPAKNGVDYEEVNIAVDELAHSKTRKTDYGHSAKEPSKAVDAEHNLSTKDSPAIEPIKKKGIINTIIESVDNDSSGILYMLFSIIGFILMFFYYAIITGGAKALAEFIVNLLFNQ